MPRTPIPSWYFVLVVVRRGDRFLLVEEGDKHGGGYYLPAGRVEPGETLQAAALRETLEEAGIPIALDGVLRVEHSPHPSGSARVRVFFTGHPIDDTPPKSVADRESKGARWATLTELASLRLRGSDAAEAIRAAADGRQVLPLDTVVAEGAPFRP